jgi:hypothetical protein
MRVDGSLTLDIDHARPFGAPHEGLMWWRFGDSHARPN